MKFIKKCQPQYEKFAIKLFLYVPFILTLLLNISRDNLDYLTLLLSSFIGINAFKNTSSFKFKSYIEDSINNP